MQTYVNASRGQGEEEVRKVYRNTFYELNKRFRALNTVL